MVDKVLKKLRKKKYNGLLITSRENMRYLSGFTGEGAVFVSESCRVVITDFRYVTSAKAECGEFEILDAGSNKFKILNQYLTGENLKIGFESNKITVAEFERWKNEYQNVTWISFEHTLDRIRGIKTKKEIEKITKAEAIGDKAFQKIIHVMKPGMTEKQIALLLESYMRAFGADGISFDTIVASGVHSAMPHAVPTDRALKNGDTLILDFGCKVSGYCSDMTRTVFVGKASEKQRKVYDIVRKAQKAALKGIRANVQCSEIDALARGVIEREGYGKQFGHGLGHSVGLEIHEEPRFSPKINTILKKNMVITVEPGIYIEGDFGVRIEDLVVITKEGNRNLTNSTKELLQI